MTQLFLRQTKQEVRLVLGLIDWALQKPATRDFVELYSRVVAGRYLMSANLSGYNK
jgi:hypothetical protein